MTDEAIPRRPCARTFTLEDLHVRSDGGGRVVEAYAAVWRDASGKQITAEIRDQDGHYNETLTPTAFNRTIQHRGLNFGVLFNHGMTIDGSPNPNGTMPVGVPLDVHADDRGVFTATRYLDNPLADWTLDAIKQGAIRAQSYSGLFRKSSKTYPQGRSALPLITRHEVEMREYGPAVFAAFEDAVILGSRAELFMRTLLATPPDKRLDWLQQFEFTTPSDPVSSTDGTSDSEPAVASTDDSHSHSARSALRSHIRAERQRRGME
jgi:HK97 family phage prohead protease